MDVVSRIEALLSTPVYVIDLLPEQVPAGSRGQYFAIDAHWRRDGGLTEFNRKVRSILTKLNCYYDLELYRGGSSITNPTADELDGCFMQFESGVCDSHLNVFVDDDDALVVVSSDDLSVAVYNPDERLQRILSQLALSEGLFFWRVPV